jgi:hypothetical protein
LAHNTTQADHLSSDSRNLPAIHIAQCAWNIALYNSKLHEILQGRATPFLFAAA